VGRRIIGKIIMKIQLTHKFEDIICLENLLEAWKEFVKGKKNKKDVQEFSLHLMDNLILLNQELSKNTYNHGAYQAFKINDPKPRDIHKATVRDRLLHHAIYRKLYPFFDRTFIADSYSCRINKGTHKAITRFLHFGQIVSKNNSKNCWILKGDIKKFFANINHQILNSILCEYIPNKNIIRLLEKVIGSFVTKGKIGIGLPLGNLTSQLLVNIYMNKFDQLVKHKLKIKNYIRYADDFVIFSENRNYLEDLIPVMSKFLKNELKLELHPDKIFLKNLSSGIDFLGYANFSDHRVLRTKTKRRMMKKLRQKKMDVKNGLISAESFEQSRQSYLGILGHCRGWRIMRELEDVTR